MCQPHSFVCLSTPGVKVPINSLVEPVKILHEKREREKDLHILRDLNPWKNLMIFLHLRLSRTPLVAAFCR